jgi:plasmid stabilization system protein ParE
VPQRVLRISTNAQRHIEQGLDWWDEHREKSPGAFDADLRAAFAVLVEKPEIGTRSSSQKYPTVRRFTVRRIRYAVYYRYDDAVVEILAVWHTSRGSRPRL